MSNMITGLSAIICTVSPNIFTSLENGTKCDTCINLCRGTTFHWMRMRMASCLYWSALAEDWGLCMIQETGWNNLAESSDTLNKIRWFIMSPQEWKGKLITITWTVVCYHMEVTGSKSLLYSLFVLVFTLDWSFCKTIHCNHFFKMQNCII